MSMRTPTYILISKRFNAYDKTIRDIWEVYHFHHYYLPILHRQITQGVTPPLLMPRFPNLKDKQKTVNDTLGVISHITTQFSPQRGLVVAVSQSEVFLQYLVTQVMTDYPGRLASGGQIEQNSREIRLLDIILNSADKAEIIDKVIEERVRSLFYGQPTDFFLKDKAKLGFSDYFKKNYATTVEDYAEIVARRNLLIHNDGRVDRKYLREVPGTSLRLGQKIIVDQEYLRRALFTLHGLSATAGVFISENVYSNIIPPSNTMLRRHKHFTASL
jgi:hypothetical protein